MTEHDESRLPRWAQRELDRLRKDLELTRSTLAIGGVEKLDTDPRVQVPRDMPVLLSGEGLGYQRFGVHGDVRADWYLGNPSGKPFGHLRVEVRPTLDASPDDETLNLQVYTGSGRITAYSHSSNILIVGVRGR